MQAAVWSAPWPNCVVPNVIRYCYNSSVHTTTRARTHTYTSRQTSPLSPSLYLRGVYYLRGMSPAGSKQINARNRAQNNNNSSSDGDVVIVTSSGETQNKAARAAVWLSLTWTIGSLLPLVLAHKYIQKFKGQWVLAQWWLLRWWWRRRWVLCRWWFCYCGGHGRWWWHRNVTRHFERSTTASTWGRYIAFDRQFKMIDKISRLRRVGLDGADKNTLSRVVCWCTYSSLTRLIINEI